MEFCKETFVKQLGIFANLPQAFGKLWKVRASILVLSLFDSLFHVCPATSKELGGTPGGGTLIYKVYNYVPL